MCPCDVTHVTAVPKIDKIGVSCFMITRAFRLCYSPLSLRNVLHEKQIKNDRL